MSNQNDREACSDCGPLRGYIVVEPLVKNAASTDRRLTGGPLRSKTNMHNLQELRNKYPHKMRRPTEQPCGADAKTGRERCAFPLCTPRRREVDDLSKIYPNILVCPLIKLVAISKRQEFNTMCVYLDTDRQR